MTANPVSVEAFWSQRASSFDDAPDHGLTDPDVRAAWTQLLHRWIPTRPQRVLDVGCGTGSLSWLLAPAYEVAAIDISQTMLREAARKRPPTRRAAADARLDLIVADASAPPFSLRSFDVVLCRHLVWALPDPGRALLNWSRLLRPGGRLIAIEGRWNTSASPSPDMPWDGGVTAEDLTSALRELFQEIEVVNLAPRSELWAKDVTDERYVLIATEPARHGGSY